MCNNHLTVQQKLTQHCKSTIIQFKKNQNMVPLKNSSPNLLYDSGNSNQGSVTSERGGMG